MCKKNNFQNFLLTAIEMAVLSVFSQKKGLGPLGVKLGYLFVLFVCYVEISRTVHPSFAFLVLLESSRQGGVHVLGFVAFGPTM